MHRLYFGCLFAILGGCIYGQEKSYWDYHPLHVGVQSLRVGKADCEDDYPGHLYFRKTNAFASLLVPVDPKNYYFPRIEFNS